MSDRDPTAEVEEQVVDRERQEILDYQNAVDAPGYADSLIKVAEAYLRRRPPWSSGDLVQWRPNMRNRRFPEYGRPAIVLEADLPRRDPNLYLFPISHEEEGADTLIGWLDGDLDLRTDRVEARRLQRWREA